MKILKTVGLVEANPNCIVLSKIQSSMEQSSIVTRDLLDRNWE
jgi:hypothetical protein